jgi:hypothetical protein
MCNSNSVYPEYTLPNCLNSNQDLNRSAVPPPHSDRQIWMFEHRSRWSMKGRCSFPLRPPPPLVGYLWIEVMLCTDLFGSFFLSPRMVSDIWRDASFEPATRVNITNLNEIDHMRFPIVFECLNVRGWECASVGSRADRLPTHPHPHVRLSFLALWKPEQLDEKNSEIAPF